MPKELVCINKKPYQPKYKRAKRTNLTNLTPRPPSKLCMYLTNLTPEIILPFSPYLWAKQVSCFLVGLQQKLPVGIPVAAIASRCHPIGSSPKIESPQSGNWDNWERADFGRRRRRSRLHSPAGRRRWPRQKTSQDFWCPRDCANRAVCPIYPFCFW